MLLQKNVFIRTVTYHFVGTVIDEREGFIALKNASWVADSGRFSEAILTGTLNEVEVCPNVECLVNKASIVDIWEWKHPLPEKTK